MIPAATPAIVPIITIVNVPDGVRTGTLPSQWAMIRIIRRPPMPSTTRPMIAPATTDGSRDRRNLSISPPNRLLATSVKLV